MSYGFKIMVEGDYACFTRTEFKVERVSYEVPTPGALEGHILEAGHKICDRQDHSIKSYRLSQHPT